jgi:putative membrane protein
MNTVENYPAPSLKKNEKAANILIWVVSIVVFVVVAVLSRVHFTVDLGFNVHLFALANAIINSIVAVLLVAGLVTVKKGQYQVHKNIMLAAIILSVLFLVSYICHHLLAGETRFGDVNHDGLVSAEEKSSAGSMRTIYYILLGTHIPLAGIILPFILFTAYRSLTGEYERHRKLAKITWPIWFYVAVTGPIVYFMIAPFYA